MLSSHICGSFNTSLSSFSALFPLLGSIATSPLSFIALVTIFFGRTILIGSSITMGIPTFFAMLNWSADAQKKTLLQILLQIIIPILCIALFVIHPTGNQAWLYSMYWLIPVALWIAQRYGYQAVFLTALSSTFIAHALGSVIWLYGAHLKPEVWLALISRVAVERLVFALTGTIGYCVIQKIGVLITRSKQINMENQ